MNWKYFWIPPLGFIIYTGGSTDYGIGNTLNLLKDFDLHKSPLKVVLYLLEKHIRQGYIMTLNNYYNLPELTETLLQLHKQIAMVPFTKKKPCLEISGTGNL